MRNLAARDFADVANWLEENVVAGYRVALPRMPEAYFDSATSDTRAGWDSLLKFEVTSDDEVVLVNFDDPSDAMIFELNFI